MSLRGMQGRVKGQYALVVLGGLLFVAGVGITAVGPEAALSTVPGATAPGTPLADPPADQTPTPDGSVTVETASETATERGGPETTASPDADPTPEPDGSAADDPEERDEDEVDEDEDERGPPGEDGPPGRARGHDRDD